MPNILTQEMRTFLASAFADTLKEARTKEWVSGELIPEGAVRRNGAYLYAATTSGATGATAPSHISGTLSDGAVQWLFIGAADVDDQFHKNLYLYLGAPDAWVDDNNPDMPSDNPEAESANHHNIVSLKKLNQDSIRLVAERNDWTSQVYDRYEPHVRFSDYANPFYAMNSNYDVYKCLDNAGGAVSTEEPTGNSPLPVVTSDGYVWKYIMSIDLVDAFAFMTDEYFPVINKRFNDGSPQYAVQQAANIRSLSAFTAIDNQGTHSTDSPTVTLIDANGGTGSGGVADGIVSTDTDLLARVVVSTEGAGYSNNTYAVVQDANALGSGADLEAVLLADALDSVNIVSGGVDYEQAKVYVLGDGTGADVDITVEAGAITGASVVSGGSGYTWCQLVVVPTATGTGLDVTVTQNGGALDTVTIVNGGTGYKEGTTLVVTDSGAGVDGTLVVDTIDPTTGEVTNVLVGTPGSNYTSPIVSVVQPDTSALFKAVVAVDGHGRSAVEELNAKNVILSTRLARDVEQYFLIDADSEFRQVGIITDARDSNGDYLTEDKYIGPKHRDWDSGTQRKYQPDTGQILYVNNISTTTRTVDQEEEVKIVINF